MCIVTNKWGYDLLAFIPVSEEEITNNKEYMPLTGSLVVVESRGKFLIAYNKYRQQWELPAGGREAEETPRECVERELMEEANQKVIDLTFKGVVKIYNQATKRVKFQALYYATLEELAEFKENDEMDKIMLWDLKEHIGYVDEVDRKLIDCAVI